MKEDKDLFALVVSEALIKIVLSLITIYNLKWR
jgi:hypothetical protein